MHNKFEKLNNIKFNITQLFFCACGKISARYVLLFVLILVCFIASCSRQEPSEQAYKMDVSSDFLIRVLLLSDISQAAVSSQNKLTLVTKSGQQQEIKGRLDISVADNQFVINGSVVDVEELDIKTDSPYVLSVNGQQYRGDLKIVVDRQENNFSVINVVALEPYLGGVVGAEMPDYWEPEALKAQTIAARTYALYIKKRFGGNKDYDMRSSQANQVYRGIQAESKQVIDAINETAGLVLNCADGDGDEGIFPAYYSSTCGGHTEDSVNVFGDKFEALTGVVCEYCKIVARPKYYFWPMVEVEHKTINYKLMKRYKSLEKLEEIVDIKIKRQSDYKNFSRITAVELVGKNGKTDWLRAEDFRLAIDPSGREIKSTIFKLFRQDNKWLFQSGRGFGHAVGMCQCGAQAMARQGADFKMILDYYYPGSKIVDVYK